MIKLKKFKLIFDNAEGKFYAGQLVSGRVTVMLNAPMEVNGVTLKISGKGKVHWKETDTKREAMADRENPVMEWALARTISHSASEKYVDHTVELVPTGRTTLSAGFHEYPFQYTLPPTVPSSFEGKLPFGNIEIPWKQIASIRYHAKAKIKRNWIFDEKCTKSFTVIHAVDLNKEHISWKEPFVLSKEMTLPGRFFTEGGTVNANLTINRRCFVPGETIYINGSIENKSDSKCTIKCAFKQYIKYKATTDTMDFKKTKAEVECATIKEFTTVNLTNVAIAIPAPLPTKLDGCKIIDISYNLEIYANMLCSWSSFKIPIKIGTEQVRETDIDLHDVSHSTRYSQHGAVQQPLVFLESGSFINPSFGYSQPDDFSILDEFLQPGCGFLQSDVFCPAGVRQDFEGKELCPPPPYDFSFS